MPKLRGPRKKADGGPNWYACLTVAKPLRSRVGKSELWRSLNTSDPSLASKLYGAAIEALEAQLEALVAGPALAEQVERNRGPVLFGIPIERDGQRTWIEHEEEDPELVAETLTYNRADKEITQPLVYEALKKREHMAMTWEELRDFYAKTRLNKKGQPLSESALFEINKAIELMRHQAPYPDLLMVRHCRDIYKTLIDTGRLKPKTIMPRLGMAKTMIKTGIKHEPLKLTVNPWGPVDFIVESRPEDSYRPFSKDEVQRLFSISSHPQIWYVLFGTALRVGEFWSREISHLDDHMLVVTPAKKQKDRLKTATSYRRVPLNQKAVAFMRDLLPVNVSKDTLQRWLRKDLDQLSTRDDKLVIHSTRHTWKTWSRRVGIPIDVSDEIDGHKKKSPLMLVMAMVSTQMNC